MRRLIPIVLLACANPQVDKVASYLKARVKLEMRVEDRSLLKDSLKAFDKHYGWDLDSVKAIVMSWGNVGEFERFLKLLKEDR